MENIQLNLISKKKSICVQIPEEIYRRAKYLGINLTLASNFGISMKIKEAIGEFDTDSPAHLRSNIEKMQKIIIILSEENQDLKNKINNIAVENEVLKGYGK